MKREETPKAADVKKGISVLWETLQCPICLELMTTPVSTKCDHQFCKFCMMKLLDNSKQNRASCPVCKARVTKRSLQESPGFQKLVTGLQDMIHAYELDTGTNYFTGTVLHKHPAVVTDIEIQKPHGTSGDPSELDNLKNASSGLPKSQSSTIKAQTGFARLMGLEDSSPLTTEVDGLDSGLGGPPPASDRKKASDMLELITTEEQAAVENAQPTHRTRELIKSSDLPPLILEEEAIEKDQTEGEEGLDENEQPVRKSSRKKRKKDSDPDKILKQRQKKSVEKVREWLKSVPTEEDIELDKLDRDADNLDDSDSFSSASTIDLHQQNYESFLKTEGQTKTLEDQVFGTVYKRGKKRDGKLSPPRDILSHLSAKEEEPQEEDEINKNDPGVEPVVINLTDASSEFFKEAEPMDAEVLNDDKTPEQEFNAEQQNVNDECKEKNSPQVQTEPRKLRRASRKKMRNALEQVDNDLKEQAKTVADNSETKKTDQRKARLTRSSKAKSGRVAKPLELVEVPDKVVVPIEDPKSKLGSNQVQIHIENYPSSEDQDAAVVKSTRRSKRLQSFVEEIRVSKKKPRQLKVTKSNNEVRSEVALVKKNELPISAKTNGCIYDDDLGGIVKEGSCESPNVLKPTQPLQEVPNVNIPSESGHSEPVVPDLSRSPVGADTVQESDIQSNQNNAHIESRCLDGEEGLEDDSEIDTEQLLRSFKATKRKSFHLEALNVKRSRCRDEGDAQKSEEAKALEKEKALIQDHSNSPLSDVIPPSATQPQSKVHCQEEVDVSDHGLKSSASSALSPNKVSKFDTPSPGLSVIPQVVNSGLRFTAPRLSESVEPKKQSPKESSHVSESQYSKANDNSLSLLDPATTKNCSPGKSSAPLLNAENSLTPDGLLMHPPVPHVEVVNSLSSSSAQSSVKTHPKRRKSRRLESSPELESSGSQEDLPSLAQILKRKSSSGQDKCELEKGDSNEESKPDTTEVEQSSRPPHCPSPDYVNSSQASVDLFGTPEETGDVAPVNNASASMELSQFSSEVLVTQQKIEMQKELLRLEKLMALVSEVLQEKENGPENEQEDAKQNGKTQVGPQPSNEETEQQPESNGLQSADRNSRAGPSEVRATSKPKVGKHGGTTDTAHKDLSAPPSKTVATSSSTQGHKNRESPSEDKENNTPPNERRKPKMVLASSGLAPNEQIMVKRFAKRIGSRVVSHVTPDVTHIIMHTDERLVCERTLKYFLGIAGRKWVVSFQWISECFKQKKLVDESLFEVKGDVVNGHNHQGPMRARTTDDDDLLMKGYKIYFHGPFADMTTDEMEWMVELCGATVVKDQSALDGKQKTRQLVIVQSGSDISASKYNSLSKVATVVTRGWLLDSVSAYTIQSCKNYTI